MLNSLALAKQVAESMGGTLTVASEPGRGSTFTLSLRCFGGAVDHGIAESVEGAVLTASLQPPRTTR